MVYKVMVIVERACACLCVHVCACETSTGCLLATGASNFRTPGHGQTMPKMMAMMSEIGSICLNANARIKACCTHAHTRKRPGSRPVAHYAHTRKRPDQGLLHTCARVRARARTHQTNHSTEHVLNTNTCVSPVLVMSHFEERHGVFYMCPQSENAATSYPPHALLL